MDKITFPYKVSDKVAEAFKTNKRTGKTTKMILKMLFEIISEEDVDTGWDMLGEEHTDLLEYQRNHPNALLRYCEDTKSISVKEK